MKQTFIPHPWRSRAVLLLTGVVLAGLACGRPGEPPLESVPSLSDPLRADLRTAFDAYEECRRALAADELGSVASDAARLGQVLQAAQVEASTDPTGGAGPLLDQAVAAVELLADAPDLTTAREAFAEW